MPVISCSSAEMVPNECQRTPDSSEKSSRRFERSRRAVSRRLGTDVSSLTRGNTVEGSSGPAVAVASGLWSPCGAAELGAECLPLAGASLGARAPSGADTGTALLDIMAQLKQEREALFGMTRRSVGQSSMLGRMPTTASRRDTSRRHHSINEHTVRQSQHAQQI